MMGPETGDSDFSGHRGPTVVGSAFLRLSLKMHPGGDLRESAIETAVTCEKTVVQDARKNQRYNLRE